MSRFHPTPITRGPGSSWVKVSVPPREPPMLSWLASREKFFMDSDCTGLRLPVRASIRWAKPLRQGKAETTLCRAAFSLRKEALAAIKEVNCCWWESCYSFSRLSSCIRRWFMEVSKSKGRSPIGLVDFLNR